MPRSIHPDIENWQGGPLTVKRLNPGPGDGDTVDHQLEAWPLPLSPGLAFPTRASVPVPAIKGLRVELEHRGGAIRAVAIRSSFEHGGPELTQTVLRDIGSLREIERQGAMTWTMRLHLDDNGNIYGVPLADPLTKQLEAQRAGDDASPVVERVLGRVGRPPLPDAYLQEVADVVAEARALKKPIARTVAAHFGITEAKAKKHIRIARDRGFWSVPGRPRGFSKRAARSTYAELMAKQSS